MIDLRAGVAAVAICLGIALINDKPTPPLPQNAPLCWQPVWNKHGMQVGGTFVYCADLDRYEEA